MVANATLGPTTTTTGSPDSNWTSRRIRPCWTSSRRQESGPMNSALKWLAMVAGVACIAIGLAHVLLGTGAAPGVGAANATAESEDRFYGAVFVGYGVAWLWGAMQDPLPAKLFRFLAAIMLLGGIGPVSYTHL